MVTIFLSYLVLKWRKLNHAKYCLAKIGKLAPTRYVIQEKVIFTFFVSLQKVLNASSWSANFPLSTEQSTLQHPGQFHRFKALFRLHYAAQHKPNNHQVCFGCFGRAPRDITLRYTTTSITFKMWQINQNRTERQFIKNTDRTEARKKPAGKKTHQGKILAGNLGRIHGSCSEKPTSTKHVFQQNTVNAK